MKKRRSYVCPFCSGPSYDPELCPQCERSGAEKEDKAALRPYLENLEDREDGNE